MRCDNGKTKKEIEQDKLSRNLEQIKKIQKQKDANELKEANKSLKSLKEYGAEKNTIILHIGL